MGSFVDDLLQAESPEVLGDLLQGSVLQGGRVHLSRLLAGESLQASSDEAAKRFCQLLEREGEAGRHKNLHGLLMVLGAMLTQLGGREGDGGAALSAALNQAGLGEALAQIVKKLMLDTKIDRHGANSVEDSLLEAFTCVASHAESASTDENDQLGSLVAADCLQVILTPSFAMRVRREAGESLNAVLTNSTNTKVNLRQSSCFSANIVALADVLRHCHDYILGSNVIELLYRLVRAGRTASQVRADRLLEQAFPDVNDREAFIGIKGASFVEDCRPVFYGMCSRHANAGSNESCFWFSVSSLVVNGTAFCGGTVDVSPVAMTFLLRKDASSGGELSAENPAVCDIPLLEVERVAANLRTSSIRVETRMPVLGLHELGCNVRNRHIMIFELRETEMNEEAMSRIVERLQIGISLAKSKSRPQRVAVAAQQSSCGEFEPRRRMTRKSGAVPQPQQTSAGDLEVELFTDNVGVKTRPSLPKAARGKKENSRAVVPRPGKSLRVEDVKQKRTRAERVVSTEENNVNRKKLTDRVPQIDVAVRGQTVGGTLAPESWSQLGLGETPEYDEVEETLHTLIAKRRRDKRARIVELRTQCHAEIDEIAGNYSAQCGKELAAQFEKHKRKLEGCSAARDNVTKKFKADLKEFDIRIAGHMMALDETTRELDNCAAQMREEQDALAAQHRSTGKKLKERMTKRADAAVTSMKRVEQEKTLNGALARALRTALQQECK